MEAHVCISQKPASYKVQFFLSILTCSIRQNIYFLSLLRGIMAFLLKLTNYTNKR